MKHQEKDALKKRISIDTLFDLSDTDLYELYDRLWYEYFTPERNLTKDESNFLRRQLNLIAGEIKVYAESINNGCAEVIMIEPSTKYELDELGPNSKAVIYIDVQEPLKLVSTFKSRSGKIKKQNPGKHIDGPTFTDDEDLLGLTSEKPKATKANKVKDPNKITATTIYPELAKLADKLGDNADKISKAKPEWPRKCITDALWKWRKTK